MQCTYTYIIMEVIHFSNFVYLFSLIVFIFMLHKLRSRTKKPTLNLPPGPFKLPFIGNLHVLLASSNPPHLTLANLAKKYGPLMNLQLGEINTVIVSSPEVAKQFMKTHDLNFASRPSFISSEFHCYGNSDIAFAPYGEYWRQLRRICTLEIFSVRRVQSFRPIREEQVSKLCKWITLNEGLPISFTDEIAKTNYNIMVRATLGKLSDEQAMLLSKIREAVASFSLFQIDDVYPSNKLVHLISGAKKRTKILHEKMDSMIGSIIDQYKRDKAARIDDGDQKDENLLDVLLKVQDSGLELPLTTDNIKAVLLDLFAAGVESSSIVIDWVMSEMLKNPSVLNKAQDEVRRVFDNKNDGVDESYFDELKYLKSVIKETLRLHPTGGFLLPRQNEERCEINGYEIPAKTRVMVNAWAIGRDPKYWDDAESFKPERFLETSIDYRGNSFEYIPFGAGRRICPGISIGLANVELPLAMFLYHFDWILPNGMKPEDMEMDEDSGLAARRKSTLHVIPVVRRPLQEKN